MPSTAINTKLIAGLFVQGDGCYSLDERIDPWDIVRDARNYQGTLPVIAHPPCQLWGALAAVNYKRWGGEHNRPGNDQGCFQSALLSVQRCGGVLEHPAKTKAWQTYGINKPEANKWVRCDIGGWTCEVWQSAYGHRANKATWLYYYGQTPPPELNWDRPRGTHQVGGCSSRGKLYNKPTLSKREANATPPAFKELLISLALHSQNNATN